MSTPFTDHRRATAPDQPERTPELEELYRGFEKELLVPLWTEIGDLMPLHPRSKAAAAPVALGRTCCRWPSQAGRPRPGRPRRRAPRDRAGQPRPGRPALRHADAVGRDPVPDARRGRPRAPAHPARLPLRRRGRGRVDRRQRRPGRRCAAATSCRRPAGTGTPTTTPPTGRWPGSTGSTSRSSTPPSRSSSSSAATRSTEHEKTTPERSRSERLWGHPGLRPVSAAGATPGTPLLAYRWEDTDRALTDQLALEAEGYPGDGRARPRRGPLHQPDHRRRRAADDPHRVPPLAPRHRDRRRAARSAPRSSRCSTAAAR